MCIAVDFSGSRVALVPGYGGGPFHTIRRWVRKGIRAYSVYMLRFEAVALVAEQTRDVLRFVVHCSFRFDRRITQIMGELFEA